MCVYGCEWKEALNQSENRSMGTTVIIVNTYCASLSGLFSALSKLHIYDFTTP